MQIYPAIGSCRTDDNETTFLLHTESLNILFLSGQGGHTGRAVRQ